MGKIGFSFLGVFLVVTLLAPAMIAAQEVVERLPSGVINWTQGVVTAKGSGAPPTGITIPSQARLMAERAAKADALRNLLEAVKGVRVDSETTVETYTTRSDRVMTRVSGLVIGARAMGTRYLSDGAVEVTVAVNLTGELLVIMLQELPPLGRPVMPPPSLPPAVRTVPPPPKPSPAIPPEKNAASKNRRVTADPYVVSGLTATGDKKTDVVISNRDAQIILTTAPYTGYLKNGWVMVVYD